MKNALLPDCEREFRVEVKPRLRAHPPLNQHEWLPSAKPPSGEWLGAKDPGEFPFNDAERAELLTRLGSFTSLQRGWDSYDAEPPSETAIGNARRILHVLWGSEIAPPIRQISPSVEGGVAIVFTGQDKKYADIECFNNGDIMAITSDGIIEPSVWSLNGEAGSIRRAVEKLNAFFDG